jgi:hypothetical protein
MKVGAFDSRRQGTTRHHNNNRCSEGNLIISTDRVRGARWLPTVRTMFTARGRGKLIANGLGCRVPTASSGYDIASGVQVVSHPMRRRTPTIANGADRSSLQRVRRMLPYDGMGWLDGEKRTALTP